jgi:hypothetical protein
VEAAVLDALVAELRSVLVGRAVGRARAVGEHAVAFEAGGRSFLWIDASRDCPGIYWIGRARLRSLASTEAAAGRTRHAVLLLRKHLDGRRVERVARVPGERTLLLEAGSASLALRVSGAPAATLAVDGAAATSWGPGRDAWPPPDADPVREASWRIGAPPPCAIDLPGAVESVADRDLAACEATLGRARPGAPAPSSWIEAAAWHLEARTRGLRFRRRRDAALAEGRRERKRLERLLGHLQRDLAGLPAPEDLRRSAEALLAFSGEAPPGVPEIEVPDPYAPGTVRRVTIDPGLGVHASADRLFDRARRIEQALVRVQRRSAETREALRGLGEREAACLAARSLSDLGPAPRRPVEDLPGRSGPRHYLTSRGLSVLVGRGGRENQRLTFGVAGPEDLWLHARGVPGGHVILRDPEGRAKPDDLREAAEIAAFFSAARGEGKVDVHVAARKHLRPARGAAGRVRVGHSETLRVAPRDPEGRLRRR